MKRHPSGEERCPAEEVPRQSGRYRGGLPTFLHVQQLGPEQGTAVHEMGGVLAFLVPSSQCTAALNGIHHDADHQGQQRTLALAQECFWSLMMVEDCKALVRGCPRCCTFEGVIPKAPLCPIRVHAPLELVHVDFTSMESTMELNKPPSIKNVLVITDHFMHYALAVMTKHSKGAL